MTDCFSTSNCKKKKELVNIDPTPNPIFGMQAILDFFKGFMDSISADLQFAIDEISEEDTKAVGVTWHLGMLTTTRPKLYIQLFPPLSLSLAD